MSCPEFERKGYLFLSEELDRSERTDFKKHLKQCPDCREALKKVEETWNLMERLPFESPSPETREVVLKHARRKKTQSSFWERFKSVLDFWTFHRGLSLGLSAVAVTAILLLVLARPFGRRGVDGETILEWQDNFIAEADWIDKEIDRVESGLLLINYTSSEEEYSEPEDWLSPMSQDLDWIRGKVEELVKTIYGI